MSVRTIKLPIQINSSDLEEIKNLILNYNSVLRFTYNRYQENPKYSTKKITALQHRMNNVHVDSHFLNSARYVAKSMSDKHKVIFGGKSLFVDRCRGKISREEFKLKRMVPLCSIGEANKQSNRKFKIVDENHILFKPDKDHHYTISLPKLHKNYKEDILKLIELQNNCICPITYRLNLTYIELSFENNYLKQINYDKVSDRVFAVDLNPNYIGWSVIDWMDFDNYKLIDAGVVSNKHFTDIENSLKVASDSSIKLKLNNKRDFENIDTVLYLMNICKHYRCQIFSIENLGMNTSDKKLGRRYNRLVNNQWNRNKTYNLFHKYCDINDIQFMSVAPNYSSFEGNLMYRELSLPDMCLSSVEIGRRGFEFYHQYIKKDKPQQKNIIFNESQAALGKVRQSLEELSYDVRFVNLKELYIQLKTRNLKYRVPLEIFKTVCSKKSIKSKVLLISM